MSKFKSWREIAKFIDHTLLSMNATTGDILKLCGEAVKEGFHAVCVNPFHVATAAKAVAKSDVRVASVIDFPLGQSFTDVKVKESVLCIKGGANELDVVSNLSLVREGRIGDFKAELEKVINEAKKIKEDVTVKVIVEVGCLTREEVRKASLAAVEAGAEIIKTCTGRGPRGVTVKDVEFLRSVLPKEVGIKAAGGVRNLDLTLKLIGAGATRIGTSSAIAIIDEAKKRFPG